jgi:uncharacterized protein
MNILIAGGTGFIGTALIKHWHGDHRLTVLGRSIDKIKSHFSDLDKIAAMDWDAFKSKDTAWLEEFDLVINLCGASIGDKRWSKSQKQILLSSRIEPTNKLATALAACVKSPRFFSASAVGYYGLQPPVDDSLPDALDEDSKPVEPADDFLSAIGKQWEAACQPALDAGVVVSLLRFGVVLDKSGGALPKIAMPYYVCLGGPMGSGDQPLSWISLNDLIRAFDFLLAYPEVSGPINMTAVQCVKQKEFAHSLGRALHRPAFLPMPGPVVELLFGQMGRELLLSGQHVIPTRLLKAGFEFQYPDLDSALTDIYT